MIKKYLKVKNVGLKLYSKKVRERIKFHDIIERHLTLASILYIIIL